MKPWAYYATAARRCGVATDDVPDAVQEMQIAAWRHGSDGAALIYHWAVNAARRYGRRSQQGCSRETVELDPHLEAVDLYAVVDKIMDYEIAWMRLTARERQIICRWWQGKPDVTQGRVSYVRKRARSLVA